MVYLQEIVAVVTVFGLLIGMALAVGSLIWRYQKRRSIGERLKRHFKPIEICDVSVTERQFPLAIRADLQQALHDFIGQARVCLFTGMQTEGGLGGVDFSTLLDENQHAFGAQSLTGPPQYEQIDVGEKEPVHALLNGLWLLSKGESRFAILYAPRADFGECGVVQRVRVQIAASHDESGDCVAQDFFRMLEAGVLNSANYRGKTLSLEQDRSYYGQSSGVKVNRIGLINREQVVLPRKTQDLLDRNVVEFVKHRLSLGRLQMTTKKGLLFYGPPGAGKTHTIRYLAGALKDHTTFLVAAEQVSLLSEYTTLARLLQPSIVVIEDVDLIARDREEMRDPGEELLLNKLLNEMDGLKEDCQILFILTSNRPDKLESALAARPGRIDQAIEFPLPDAESRRKARASLLE